MFLHDPMTVDTDRLTVRELKELIQILRASIETAQERGGVPEVWCPPSWGKAQEQG